MGCKPMGRMFETGPGAKRVISIQVARFLLTRHLWSHPQHLRQFSSSRLSGFLQSSRAIKPVITESFTKGGFPYGVVTE
jgi:hypothetical protein